MNIKEIIKEIKGVFNLPKKEYYIGKIQYGTPYFDPMYFISTIIKIKKLKYRSEKEIEERNKKYPYLIDSPKNKYSNYPMVRRSKNKILRLFNNDYYITWGWPIKICRNHLGWKDKWDKPSFEWTPAFHIFFFKWQFCIWWISPDGNNDLYYEMILWYLKYSDKNINKARNTWKWKSYTDKKSTWNNNYLI
ncbi:MAG: hypothetical protein ACOC3V_00580 [bacterium]